MPVIREMKRLSAADRVPMRAEDQERYYAELAAAEHNDSEGAAPESVDDAPDNHTTDQAEDYSTDPKE